MVVLLSAMWTLAALLAIAAFATAAPGDEAAPRAVAQAARGGAVQRPAPSPMLRVSTQAIAKDKLD
ncbi:hypothetical protein ACVNIS_15405 [Sphaerotilaceae bacterium SBD11-9]